MKRPGSYLGGSTILSARKNPYVLDNTTPTPIGGEPPPHICVERRDFSGSYEDWLELGLATQDFLLAAQQAVLYGDVDAFKRLALEDTHPHLQNGTLTRANTLMTGRAFDRAEGKILLHKEGKLDWNWQALANLHRALLKTAEDWGDDPPDLDPRFLEELAAARPTSPEED